MTDDTDPSIPLIQGFEGFRADPYWDVNHHRVGYGSDTITKPDGSVAEVKPGMSVTQSDAQRDLQRRVGEYQSHIKDQIGEDAWNKLTPAARASLTSVAYNYGHLPYGVTLAAKAGDPGKIATSIAGLAGDNNGVNAKRRTAEANNVLGIGGQSGRFGVDGVMSGPNHPTASASASSSANDSSADLLSAYTKALHPGPSIIGALLQKANGGKPVPGLLTSLKSLFGGSNNQAGQGAPDQAGSVAPAASPLPAAAGQQPPQPPGRLPSLALAPGGTTPLVEGRSAAEATPYGKFPDAEPATLYKPAPGTLDSNKMPQLRPADMSRYAMPVIGQEDADGNPVTRAPRPTGPAVLGGRGRAPLMMNSSPPDPGEYSGGSGTIEGGSPTTPRILTGDDTATPGTWGQPDLPSRPSAQSTFDIPSMLRTLFGTGA